MPDKKQKTLHNITWSERSTLIVCVVIMIALILLVSISTGLWFYAALHILLVLVTLPILLLKTCPKSLVRTLIVLNVVGAASAIFIVLAFMPLYNASKG
jgi:hypothetical protein